MSALEKYEDAPPPALPTNAYTIGDLAMLADRIARTGMVPSTLRGKPDEILATLMYGVECGLPAMQSLQLIDMMQGRPTLNAQGQRALILAAGHQFWIEHSDAEKCVVKAIRRNTDRELTVTFTIDDARERGLLGKENWKKQPADMLVARATTRMSRRHFSDVVLGLGYDAEELEPVRFTGAGSLEPPTPPEPRLLDAERVAKCVDYCDRNGVSAADAVRVATDGRTDDPAELLTTEVAAVARAVDALKTPGQPAGDEAQGSHGASVADKGEGVADVPATDATPEPDEAHDRARKRFFAVVNELWSDLGPADKDATRKRWLKATFGVDSASKLTTAQLREAADLLAAEIPQPSLLDSEPVDAEIVDTEPL